MLLELQIENYALIDSLSLEFGSGLNVLTGETGAGKSILIEALRLALGERVEASQARDASKLCSITAVFSPDSSVLNKDSRWKDFLNSEEDNIIFRREITPEGRSKCSINRQAVNLSVVRELGAQLIHIHSQHDHQQILDSAEHRPMLDRFARCGEAGRVFSKAEETYWGLYTRYCELSESRDRLIAQQSHKERELDLLRYQTEEVARVQPQKDELSQLTEEKIRLTHVEKLSEVTAGLMSLLDEDESAASVRIASAFRLLADWIKIDPGAQSALQSLELSQEHLTEAIRFVQDYRERLNFDDSRLQELELRIEQLERLVKKYGDPLRPHALEPVLDFYEKACQKLGELENSETLTEDLTREIKQLMPLLDKAASQLTKLRRSAGEGLAREVVRELAELGIKQARFACQIHAADYGPAGKDRVEFMLSANPGQEPAVLGAVASGGEAARIMLALKKTLAQADDIPALIFDEIDANIGGRLGSVVGDKIKAISRHRQILLITHLPQIASYADRHIKVVKKAVGRGVTRVDYELLDAQQRVRELAQMMSGEDETQISKTHAQEMLRSAAKKA